MTSELLWQACASKIRCRILVIALRLITQMTEVILVWLTLLWPQVHTWPVSPVAGSLLALSLTISTPNMSPWPRTSPMMLCFSCSALILSSSRLPTCRGKRSMVLLLERQR